MNKMIERGLNYANYIIKEMTDLFETRVENLDPRGERKNLLRPPRIKKDLHKEKEK